MTDRESAIFELQQYLRNIMRNKSDESAIIPDGIFSEETKKSVEEFQRIEGLTVTGVVNFETWEAIRRVNSRAVYENTLPIQVAPIKNSDLPLRTGLNNSFVGTLKTMLNHVAQRHENFNFLGEGNLFDSDTEREVRRWQGVAFLEITGEVDKETWNSLAQFYLL